MVKQTYLSESHRKRSEALQKEVAEMSRHPLSREQKILQIRTIKEKAEARAKQTDTSC